MIWLTSDTHFGHRNVIRYSQRPFLKDPSKPDPYGYDWNLDVDAMDATLIANWNAVVKPGDTVYHLGDFIMGPNGRERATAIRGQLNGKIILVLGNHDRGRAQMLSCGFDGVERQIEETFNGVKVWMRHYPPERPTGEYGKFDLLLHGHVHTKYRDKGKVINVGVDVWSYTPVSLEKLLTVAGHNGIVGE
jgi:calcineurin-like phosphoesterase family protein